MDKRGRVYVADRENYRIQVFAIHNTWSGIICSPQGEPTCCHCSRNEFALAIADGYNGRVLKLTLDGKVLGAFGRLGRMPGELLFAHHLSVGPDNSIYTAEILNWRPQKFVLR